MPPRCPPRGHLVAPSCSHGALLRCLDRILRPFLPHTWHSYPAFASTSPKSSFPSRDGAPFFSPKSLLGVSLGSQFRCHSVNPPSASGLLVSEVAGPVRGSSAGPFFATPEVFLFFAHNSPFYVRMFASFPHSPSLFPSSSSLL